MIGLTNFLVENPCACSSLALLQHELLPVASFDDIEPHNRVERLLSCMQHVRTIFMSDGVTNFLVLACSPYNARKAVESRPYIAQHGETHMSL
jgi:hypothetical protein